MIYLDRFMKTFFNSMQFEGEKKEFLNQHYPKVIRGSNEF